ncbi:MAG: CoA transferase [Propionibacteriaceae bacterium]|jgi:crotonobetainyl-CoA:carnitine CoA-transferase CaiB-like acyl-CoA transferase|nr:CoA transferase [Propionibacteriaceae bacterium]
MTGQGGTAGAVAGVGPLDGVVVADFTQLVQGPYAAQILADLGAEVIKIEPPAGDWLRRFALGNTYLGGESVSFLAFNRNKQSIVLNLKRPDQREAARRIAAQADVLLENFRPGVMERLGLGYDSLRQINPGLVYCASSGYGTSGPYVERPGQDLLVQAMTGLPTLMGRAGDPPVPVGIGLSDLAAGLHMVYGTLAALVERARTGQGRRVDVNLLNSLLALESQELTAHLNSSARPGRNPHMAGTPYTGAPYGLYPTRDGFIAIAMNLVGKLMAVVGAVGFEDVDEANVTDPELDGRIRRALGERLAQRDTADWLDALLAEDIWCAPLNDFDAVVEDPQVAHNQMILELDHPTAGRVRVIGPAVAFGDAAGRRHAPPPRLGEHGAQILTRFAGYSEDEAARVLGPEP